MWKVCLSILGTWHGEGWDKERSTLLQVAHIHILLLICIYIRDSRHQISSVPLLGRAGPGQHPEHHPHRGALLQ